MENLLKKRICIWLTKKIQDVDLKFKFSIVVDKRIWNRNNVFKIVWRSSNKKVNEVSVINIGGGNNVKGLMCNTKDLRDFSLDPVV